MVFFSFYLRDFGGSWRGGKETSACSSLELIFKVVITWKDLLKNYAAVMVLKDKCRKWYSVPELILLLPWAPLKDPWVVTEERRLLERSWKWYQEREVAVSDVSGWVWRRYSWEWGWPQGNVFSYIHQRLAAILDHGADQRTAWSWPTPVPVGLPVTRDLLQSDCKHFLTWPTAAFLTLEAFWKCL